MPRPKSTGLPHEEEERLRIHNLLDTAAQVFLEQGYEGASTAEMAKRANASKQTFYMRYATKEKLFLAVVDYRTAKLSEAHSSVISMTGPIRQVLTKAARSLLAFILNPEHIALLRIVYMEARQFPEAAKLLVERGPDKWLSSFAEYLSHQSEAGVLKLEDPPLAARQFAGLIVGDLVHRALLGLLQVNNKKVLETRIGAGIDAFLKIYASR